MIPPTFWTDEAGDRITSIISTYKDGRIGSDSICEPNFLRELSANKSRKAHDLATVDFSISVSHGFERYWCADRTDFRIVFRSDCPERTIRTIWGYRFITSVNNCEPSIPGIRISVTSKSTGSSFRISNASCPLEANATSHSCRMLRSILRSPSRTFCSSSTKRILLFIFLSIHPYLGSIGSRMMKVLPLPESGWNVIFPPCFSTMTECEIANP